MRFLSSPVEKLALLGFLAPFLIVATEFLIAPHFPGFPEWLVMIAVTLFLAWAAGLFAAGWMMACGAFATAVSIPLLGYLTESDVPLLPFVGILLVILVMGGHHLLTRRGGP